MFFLKSVCLLLSKIHKVISVSLHFCVLAPSMSKPEVKNFKEVFIEDQVVVVVVFIVYCYNCLVYSHTTVSVRLHEIHCKH